MTRKQSQSHKGNEESAGILSYRKITNMEIGVVLREETVEAKSKFILAITGLKKQRTKVARKLRQLSKGLRSPRFWGVLFVEDFAFRRHHYRGFTSGQKVSYGVLADEAPKFSRAPARFVVAIGVVAATMLTPASIQADCTEWATQDFFKLEITKQQQLKEIDIMLLQKVKDCLNAGADPNETDKRDGTTLHYAVRLDSIYDGFYGDDRTRVNPNTNEIVKTLLDAGANPNATANDGHTPLHGAARWTRYVDVVKTLLDAGANTSATTLTDFDGYTPLHWAVLNENVEVVRTLLDAGADINATGSNDRYTPLHFAIDDHRYDLNEMVRTLLDAGANPNATDEDGRTPLHIVDYYIVSYEEETEITLLLDAGANPNATDELDRRTPLHLAVQGEDVKAVKTLLDAGADPNKTDFDRYTPLHFAAIDNEYAEVALALLDAGANANAADWDGVTPLDLAVANDNKVVADAIRTAGR